MAIFLLAISPHLIWLQENEYITLSYAFHRTGLQEMNFYNHIIHPVTFLIKQIGIIVPSLAMLLTLCSKFKSKFNFKDKKFLFLLSINLTQLY